MNTWFARIVVSVLMQLFVLHAYAQNYPSQQIRFIVPITPGGLNDTVARIIGAKLGDVFGQQIVVTNRPGASGTIGAGEVAKATPDGHTLLITGSDLMTLQALLPKASFDAEHDLVPVTMIATATLVLVAKVDGPIASVKELVASARKNPATIGIGTVGNRTLNHLAAEWFALEAGIKLLHVPYRGGAPVVIGILTGDVPVGVVASSTALPYVTGGKLKVLSVLSNKRQSFAFEWPTAAENGMPDIEVEQWVGLFAPKDTPSGVISLLATEASRVLGDSSVRGQLHALGLEPAPMSGTALVNRIRVEKERYARIIEKTGIRVEP